MFKMVYSSGLYRRTSVRDTNKGIRVTCAGGDGRCKEGFGYAAMCVLNVLIQRPTES